MVTLLSNFIRVYPSKLVMTQASQSEPEKEKLEHRPSVLRMLMHNFIASIIKGGGAALGAATSRNYSKYKRVVKSMSMHFISIS